MAQLLTKSSLLNKHYSLACGRILVSSANWLQRSTKVAQTTDITPIYIINSDFSDNFGDISDNNSSLKLSVECCDFNKKAPSHEGAFCTNERMKFSRCRLTWRIRWHKPYFAYETARVSRITVILTCPGILSQATKKASLIKGRFGGIVYVTEWRIRWHKPYFAYETARVSRITVIFTWPGYVISSWIFFAMSCDRLSASWSESLSAPTMTRSSRPAWMA